MERTRIAGHVRPKHNIAPAKGESAVADAVDERNERKAACLQDVSKRTVAIAQYWSGAIAVIPFESGNCAADGRA
jgi:hypothetical protein